MSKHSWLVSIKRLINDSVKKIILIILFPIRNKFMLLNIFNRAKKGYVNINYWNEGKNLGDSIAPIIIDHILFKNNKTYKSIANNKYIHLYSTGSIITAGIQDCIIWGSGILNSKLLYRINKRKFKIYSVRGPLTRIILLDLGFKVPQIYGDPALLFPDIYKPSEINKKVKYGVVLHKDHDLKICDNDFLIIDICTDDYISFINMICSVEIVISSSLHGIILAEAYNVPAVLLKPQCDLFKYFDYYYSTGRYDFPMVDSIDEAINTKPIEIPDFTQLKNGLYNTFPLEIFKDKN